jgi:phosphoribosylglycinamide formyltransferase-1
MAANIAVFASGRGSNLEAIMLACKSGLIDGKVCVVISNNAEAEALSKAKLANTPTYCVDPSHGLDILDILLRHKTDIVVLAGYLKKLNSEVIEIYKQIINIHPSLLPKYGGKGMYGLAVHEAVIANGDEETGVTIHMVTEEYDKGAIIEQLRISVHENDTSEELAKRVNKYEHILLVHTIQRLIVNG